MVPSMSGRPSIWSGVFDTWDEAVSAAGSISKGTSQAFDAEIWMDNQESMLTSASSGVSPRFTNLPILIGVSSARSVVDLGGGSGWTFEFVCHNNTIAIEKYVIIERQNSVDAFAPRFIGDDRVQFFASETVRHDWLNSVDVLYSNSALQYFPSNRFLAELIVMCAPKWILLDDIQTSMGGEFFSTQHYYGTEIPCRFCDVKKLVKEFQQMGYALKGNWNYPASIGGPWEHSLSKRTDTLHDIGSPSSILLEAT
jgi:putative methyltransferase (TIGR04325 family)